MAAAGSWAGRSGERRRAREGAGTVAEEAVEDAVERLVLAVVADVAL